MKLDKLAKTLRRDLAANPMKAGVLGVLLLGGLYFWGPLFWKWVGKKGTANSSTAAVVPPSNPGPAEVQNSGALTASGSSDQQTAEFRWREIRDQRGTDPLARSAEFRPEWSKLFHVAVAVTPDAAQSSAAKTKKQLEMELDPRKLSMVLQGVAIGTKTKKAVINGRVYRELDWITVKQDLERPETSEKTEDRSPDFKFRLVRVFRRMVEVERGGKTWKLTLASAESESREPAEKIPAAQPQEKPKDEKADLPASKETGKTEE